MQTPDELEAALGADGPMLVEAETDRRENVAVHERLYEAVRQAVVV